MAVAPGDLMTYAQIKRLLDRANGLAIAGAPYRIAAWSHIAWMWDTPAVLNPANSTSPAVHVGRMVGDLCVYAGTGYGTENKVWRLTALPSTDPANWTLESDVVVGNTSLPTTGLNVGHLGFVRAARSANRWDGSSWGYSNVTGELSRLFDNLGANSPYWIASASHPFYPTEHISQVHNKRAAFAMLERRYVTNSTWPQVKQCDWYFEGAETSVLFAVNLTLTEALDAGIYKVGFTLRDADAGLLLNGGIEIWATQVYSGTADYARFHATPAGTLAGGATLGSHTAYDFFDPAYGSWVVQHRLRYTWDDYAISSGDWTFWVEFSVDSPDTLGTDYMRPRAYSTLNLSKAVSTVVCFGLGATADFCKARRPDVDMLPLYSAVAAGSVSNPTAPAYAYDIDEPNNRWAVSTTMANTGLAEGFGRPQSAMVPFGTAGGQTAHGMSYTRNVPGRWGGDSWAASNMQPYPAINGAGAVVAAIGLTSVIIRLYACRSEAGAEVTVTIGSGDTEITITLPEGECVQGLACFIPALVWNAGGVKQRQLGYTADEGVRLYALAVDFSAASLSPWAPRQALGDQDNSYINGVDFGALTGASAGHWCGIGLLPLAAMHNDLEHLLGLT